MPHSLNRHEDKLNNTELAIIKGKLNGKSTEVIAESLCLKEYQVRDILKHKHVKAELAKGYDELAEQAQEILKEYGIEATLNLVNAMKDPNVTAQNLKAILTILEQNGIVNNKIKTENININKNENGYDDETKELLKQIWEKRMEE